MRNLLLLTKKFPIISKYNSEFLDGGGKWTGIIYNRIQLMIT